MKSKFLKITKIIKEAVGLIKKDKDVEDIFKKALIKIKQEEEVNYPPNGPKLDGLINHHNNDHWSY